MRKHHLLTSPTENPKPKTEKNRSIATRKLPESIEALNRSLALAAGASWPKKCWTLYWPARASMVDLCWYHLAHNMHNYILQFLWLFQKVIEKTLLCCIEGVCTLFRQLFSDVFCSLTTQTVCFHIHTFESGGYVFEDTSNYFLRRLLHLQLASENFRKRNYSLEVVLLLKFPYFLFPTAL